MCRSLGGVDDPRQREKHRLAFDHCEGLENVAMGSGVTDSAIAFLACANLPNAAIGAGVVSIGDFAFSCARA